MDPTISVGGILDAIGGNIRVGGHDTFLTEACEYTNSFLHFFPKISVILNIDADHLDFFKDLDDIRHSFRKFAQLLPDDGTLIVNSEIEHLDQLTKGLTCKIVTYGMDASSDYYASNITFDEFAHPSFDCYKGDTLLGHFVLHVPGIHNVSNAHSFHRPGRSDGRFHGIIPVSVLRNSAAPNVVSRKRRNRRRNDYR